MTDARYSRQSGLLDPEILAHLPIAVAGVGAVGRQLVLQLVSAGARNIQFFDHDLVEAVNLGPQGWSERQVGLHKTVALFQEIEDRYGDELLEGIRGRVSRCPLGPLEQKVFFCCVDSIETRGRLFEAHGQTPGIWLDSRVVADTIHILSSCEEEQWDYYRGSIFNPEDADRGSCTTKMSIHLASISAGLLIQQLSKWLRQVPTERHLVFNLLAMECFER